MDLFTHSLLPYLLGNFFKRKKDEVTALVLGGIAPDFDIFILWINSVYPNFFLTTHRGITHSLFFGFFTGVLVMYLAARKKDLIKRVLKLEPEIRFTSSAFVFMYLGVLIHLFLDYITTRGVPLFYPFEVKRWAAELFFFTDTYLTIFSLAAIILLYKTRPITHELRTRKILALFFAVFVVLGGIRYVEKSDAQASYTHAEAFPTMSMFRWYALSEDDNSIRVHEYNGWNKTMLYSAEFNRTRIVSPGNAPPFEDALVQAEKLPQVKMFYWRAYATAINASYKDAWVIEFYDPVQKVQRRDVPAVFRRAFGGFGSLTVKVENGKASVIEVTS